MEEKKTEKAATEINNQEFAANKYLWIIGAVMLLVFGWFGIKMVSSSFEDYKLTLVAAPKEGRANANSTFTWRIDGPPTVIYHTAIYLGKTSVPGQLAKDISPFDVKYTEVLKDFNWGKYSVPLQFVGNIIMPSSGKYYYRLHALVKGNNYWSEEYSFDVK